MESKGTAKDRYGIEISPGDVVYLRCTVSEHQAGAGNMVRLETSDSALYASRQDILSEDDLLQALVDDGK